MELPKLPPDTIVRHHLDDWLDRNASRRVRIVSGQPGSGKTVAVAAWARHRAQPVRWLTVALGATESELRALLPHLGDDELVVDGADRAAADGRDFLAALTRTAPAGARLVYVVRNALAPTSWCRASRSRCSTRRRCASTTASSNGSARRTASRRPRRIAGASSRRRAAGRSRPPARCATPRRSAAASAPPFRAGSRRRARSSRSWSTKPPATRRSPRARSIASPRGVATGTDDLREACEAGFFVDRAGDAYGVNPVVASLRGDARGSARPAPAVVHMFGRFRVTIGTADCASAAAARAR